jgi:hypothetical protein
VKQISPQRLFVEKPIPRGLWSLWDMLKVWGYVYFAAASELTYAETALEDYRSKTGGTLTGHGTSILDPNGPCAVQVAQRCADALRLIEGAKDELVPIPFRLEMLRTKVREPEKFNAPELYTNDVLVEVQRILGDFRLRLSVHNFYYVPLELAKFYGKPLLFGEEIAQKFPDACSDIEHAGNCLALGEPTACVLHLNRAMEIVIRRLAQELGITPDAKDSWGMVLGRMDQPIKNMPDNTPADKQKKEKWAACRVNLYHVKMAWRDPGAHGTENYSDKEAGDILKRSQDFIQQLATLL